MKSRIVLLGPPASGKGTQSELIRSRLGIESASPGAMLRRELKEGTELGWLGESFTSKGQLVPDEVVGSLIDSWLARRSGGFVLDGFPRTVPQAEILEVITKRRGTDVEGVLFLDAPVEVLKNRVANRLACNECGQTFSRSLGEVEEGDKCQCSAGQLVRRTDDAPESFEKRMVVYREQTEALVELYAKRGILYRLDAVKDPKDVFCQIVKALEA